MDDVHVFGEKLVSLCACVAVIAERRQQPSVNNNKKPA